MRPAQADSVSARPLAISGFDPDGILHDRGNDALDAAAVIVALTSTTQHAHRTGGASTQRLLCWCARQALSYLTVVDEILGAEAARATQTRLLAFALRAQSERAREAIDRLAHVGAADHLAADGHTVAVLVREYVSLVQDVLVPALRKDLGLNMGALAEQIDSGIARVAPQPPPTLDVRELPLSRRYDVVAARCRRLSPSESFILISNLSPQLPSRELEALHPGEYCLEPLDSRAGQWQARITRQVASDALASPTRAGHHGTADGRPPCPPHPTVDAPISGNRQVSGTDCQLDNKTAAADVLLRVADVLTVLTLAPEKSTEERASSAQLRLLRVVSAHADEDRDGLHLSRIARQLGRHPSTVTRACNQLSAAGLLSCRGDPHDRRRLQVQLTPAGQALVEAMAGRSRAAVLDVLAGMREQDVSALTVAVDGFLRAAGRARLRPDPARLPASDGRKAR